MLGQTLPKEENIDLIVLGATGLSYIERIFIGSVADYIIKMHHVIPLSSVNNCYISPSR